MTLKQALGIGWVALGLMALSCGESSSGGDGSSGTGGRDGSSGTGGRDGSSGAGGGAQGGAGTAEGPTLSELPALMADAYCDVVSECIPEDLVAAWLGTPNCAELMKTRIENGFYPAAESALASGTLAYDPAEVDACLAAIRGSGCMANQQLSECDAALDGTVAEGDDCLHDLECAGDLICIVDGLCPGQCQEQLADGEACTREEDCREGSVCFDSQCTAQLPLDADCTEDGVDCVGGLVCAGADDEAGTTGTCRPWDEVFSAAEGEACDLAGPLCASGSVCVVTIVSDSLDLTCGARAQSGGDCGLAIPDMCPTGEYCTELNPDAGDLEGTCAPLPGDGDPCADGRCAGDHVCIDGTCVRLKENGVDCSTHDECYSERCSEGVCSADTDCAL